MKVEIILVAQPREEAQFHSLLQSLLNILRFSRGLRFSGRRNLSCDQTSQCSGRGSLDLTFRPAPTLDLILRKVTTSVTYETQAKKLCG